MIPFDLVQRKLFSAYGPQGWWPAETAFEVMVGAVLVQRTAWRNAALAIEALRSRALLEPGSLHPVDETRLADWIRPAGFYRTKAARLKKLAGFVVGQGGIDSLASEPARELRQKLLGLDGIGPETADAILLYAFERPAVVVDAYLRRLAGRLLNRQRPPPDRQLRAWIESEGPDSSWLNEFHALVVTHGQKVCRLDPDCHDCVLRSDCRSGALTSDSKLGERIGNLAQNSGERRVSRLES